MRTNVIVGLTVAMLATESAHYASAQVPARETAPRATMPAFGSQREMEAFVRALRPLRRQDPPVAPPANCGVEAQLGRPAGFFSRARRRRGAVLEGTVRSQAGAPMADVSVSLMCAVGAATRTDKRGRFRLELPDFQGERRVTLLVRAIGYARMLDTFDLRAGATARLQYTMRQDVLYLEQAVVTGVATRAPTTLGFTALVARQGYDGSASLAGKVTGAEITESITNNQHAEVDEGGIVKVHGDHLVVLRRGRLFTIRIGEDDLRTVATVDAFPRDSGSTGGWYDELLVTGDRAIVIGYSYQRAATEVNLFAIGADGSLRREETYHLRSMDYFSSRNYASRIADGRLIMSIPMSIDPEEALAGQLPAIRRWRSRADSGAWRPLVTPSRVHYVRGLLERGDEIVLHAVVSCRLDAAPLACDARAVFASEAETFYVSPRAVYVWASTDVIWPRDGVGALVMRLPLGGGAPSAVRTVGLAIDQLALDEDAAGTLHALVSRTGLGSWMWNAERSGRGLSLVRIPLDAFGDGRDALPASASRPLPDASNGVLVDRWVGEWLLYGAGSGWGAHQDSLPHTVVAVSRRGGAPVLLPFPHRTDRIEVMGEAAVVIGGDGGSLHFSALQLAQGPVPVQHFALDSASQAETRTHGFFYRQRDAARGTIGIPVTAAERAGWRQLTTPASRLFFLENDGRSFQPMGTLDAHGGDGERRGAKDSDTDEDDCAASCVDWYGNSRPIFLRGRVFALLGYELVEGTEAGGRITERRRVDFMPRKPAAVEQRQK